MSDSNSDLRDEVFRLADQAVTELTELDPCSATEIGRIHQDGRLTDFSPVGLAERAAGVRSILDRVAILQDQLEGRRTGQDQPFSTVDTTLAVMTERLGNLEAMSEAGDYLNDLNILASPPQSIRMAFELLPQDVAPQTLVGRLDAVPESLAGWREALTSGVAQGVPAAKRQALAVADQLEATASGWLPSFIAKRSGDSLDPVRDKAAQRAAAAFSDTATWLKDVYSQQARESDAVGEQSYLRKARAWNGDDLDLAATYEWGWEELDRIVSELRSVGSLIKADASLSEVKGLLDSSSQFQVAGVDELVPFLESLTEGAMRDLNGRLFDIPAEVQHCDVRIAAEGSAAAPYYVPPSEDLSRPGSTWYPTRGKTEFPRWWLVSVWYHEGVPGHHLQFGLAATMHEQISRFQRVFGWTSGHAEGWALYAERLMDEQGYFAEPGLRFGYLAAQAMRAARVVLDIGMHLELRVPEGREHGGQPVDARFAKALLRDVAMLDSDFAASEVDRYLGLPGQAISYKVGERTWLDLREHDRTVKGSDFDLKTWHMRALGYGPMGLGPFRSMMASESD